MEYILIIFISLIYFSYDLLYDILSTFKSLRVIIYAKIRV
jgi:hypothetical protein